VTTVAYFDVPAGCAGDMFLGALVDAGLPVRSIEETAEALGLRHVEVRARKVMRGAMAGTKVEVLVEGRPADVPTMARDPRHRHGAKGARDHDHEHEQGHEHVHEHDPGHGHDRGEEHGREPGGRHRHAHAAAERHEHRRLPQILTMLRDAKGLPAEGIADAVRTFTLLADAEAKVHGVAPDDVHFHEVGAVDALVDVVGTCVGLRTLGVTEVRVGPLPWGGGTVRTQHGRLPLPAPAVVHLLGGHPTFPSEETYEQVTPTGAALVRALSRAPEVPAGFVPRVVGVGAGTHPGGGLPNVVRLVLGEIAGDQTPAEAVLLETNLDDATGQVVARALDRAIEEGALDAWAVPATMKKGRPGVVLSVLVLATQVDRHEAILFRETPTLGIRRRPVHRSVLARRHVTVRTPFGEVRMKVREAPDGPEATPEHDDCLRLADLAGVPWRRVADAASAAWARDAR
jgi:uncharacterized protein (TIGR00299 family) protein